MTATKPWETTRGGAPVPSGREARPDELAEILEMRELLDEVVSELPDSQRGVVLMRDYDHAEWEQIRNEQGALRSRGAAGAPASVGGHPRQGEQENLKC